MTLVQIKLVECEDHVFVQKLGNIWTRFWWCKDLTGPWAIF